MEWAVGFRWEKLGHGERSLFLQWRGFSTYDEAGISGCGSVREVLVEGFV